MHVGRKRGVMTGATSGGETGGSPSEAASAPFVWCNYLISANAVRDRAGRAVAPLPGQLLLSLLRLLWGVVYLGCCVSVLRIGGHWRPLAHAFGRGFVVDSADDVLATATVAAFLTPLLEIAGILLQLDGKEPIVSFFDPITKSTSPQDLWGRRWNLHVNTVLKPAFYKPLVKAGAPKAAASVATFAASALYHEVTFAVAFPSYTLGRSTLFFVLHGAICAAQFLFDAAGAPFAKLPSRVKNLGTLCLLGPTAFLFVDIWRDDGMFESMGALTWVLRCE